MTYICPRCGRHEINKPGHDWPPAAGPPYCWWPYEDCDNCHGIGELPHPNDLETAIECHRCKGKGHHELEDVAALARAVHQQEKKNG